MDKAKIDDDGLARASAYTLHNSLDDGDYSDYTVYGDKGAKYLNDLIDYYNQELNSSTIYKKSKGKVVYQLRWSITTRSKIFAFKQLLCVLCSKRSTRKN